MVTIENLTFAFKKNQPLFSGLNLNLEKGNTYGLFGLNGAGKTTLLNLISGMLFPDFGECLIHESPAKERLPEVLSDLFILPEQFELPKMDATKYIAIQAPFYPRFDTEQMSKMLTEFQIDTGKNLTELSYGQRKKFMIAFALASNASLLLMDEPTNGLDIPSKSQFRKIMAATDTNDRCVVISTHQVRDLNTLIDRITVLHSGNIIFDQTLGSINEKLSFIKTEPDHNQPILYSEEILGGHAAIAAKEAGDGDSLIDLELLFNGVIQETELINQVFQNGGRS
jgi:ABC-2 type transport system ATP-binding protein